MIQLPNKFSKKGSIHAFSILDPKPTKFLWRDNSTPINKAYSPTIYISLPKKTPHHPIYFRASRRREGSNLHMIDRQGGSYRLNETEAASLVKEPTLPIKEFGSNPIYNNLKSLSSSSSMTEITP
ncbi:hypothetical protein PIB30_001232 [Stylosanthes scabra]|uniref:Uncharacterized protein n=1 Tax=Stylosanthes scabra TaxID=79078 RepID=A0ABU6W2A9_9FABA|nr:hypothetical protein [Stylosanthes scabra]